MIVQAVRVMQLSRTGVRTNGTLTNAIASHVTVPTQPGTNIAQSVRILFIVLRYLFASTVST